MERFRATVTESELLAYRSSLEMDGAAAKREKRLPQTLAVVLEDGSEIEARLDDQTRLGPEEIVEGRWEEVEAHVLAKPHERHAPGPHVSVRIAGVHLADGQPITIVGEVERRTSSAAIESIRARFVGVGDEAESWLDAQLAATTPDRIERSRAEADFGGDDDSHPTREPKLAPVIDLVFFGAIGVGLVAFCAIAYAGALGLNISRYLAFGIGLLLVAASLFVWRKRRGVPRMHEVGLTDEGLGMAWAAGAGWYGAGLGIGVVCVAGFGAYVGEAAYMAYGAWFVCGVCLVLAGRLVYLERRHIRLLRRITRAKPATEGQWGALTGTIEAGGIQRVRDHEEHSRTTTQLVTDTRVRADGTRAVYEETTTHDWHTYVEQSKGSWLRIATDEGEVEVESHAGCWGTTRCVFEGSRKRIEETQLGDSIVVVGRLRNEQMRPTGPQSLFLFSAPSDALGAARRALRGHWLVVVSLLVFGGVAAAAAVVNVGQDSATFEGRVATSSVPGVSTGDTCALHLSWMKGSKRGAQPHRCQAQLSCGGKVLYGGFSLKGIGYFDCDAHGLEGYDSNPDDVDGAIELSHGMVSAERPSGRVTLSLDQ